MNVDYTCMESFRVSKTIHDGIFVFIDESGTDRKGDCYEVLCGVAIEDRDVWKIVTALKNLEMQILGTRYGGNEREIKGRKFLKKKVFRLAKKLDPIHSRKEPN